MTYIQIGFSLIALLFLTGVILNIVMPITTVWINDFVLGLNGDTCADGKDDWE